MKSSNHKLNILTGEARTSTANAPSPTKEMDDDERPMAFELDVVSDVICPWCFVGKRRLEKAIALLGPKAQIKVTWRPFQLNPSMPNEGIDRNAYRKAKFGSLEQSQMLDARLTAVGATEGIPFHLDRIERTPNTLDAHRLIWLAQCHAKQDAVVEALFTAYFMDGVDVGERRNLVGIAAAAGIEKAVAEKFFATNERLNEIIAEERKFKALGIDGVPGFVINGVVLFSGAAEPQVLAQAFREAC